MVRSYRKRSCHVLAWGAIFFVTVQIVGGLALDHLWPLVRFPEARVVFDQLAELNLPPTMIFLGSSRTQGGIYPRVIEPLVEKECHLNKPLVVFNAGVPAGDPISYEFIFNHILSHSVRPEYIVIEVNPETINRRNEWLAFHSKRQLNWTHFFTHLGPTLASGAGQRWLSSRFFPLFIHREQMLERGLRYCAGQATCQKIIGKSGQHADRVVARGSIDWNELLKEPESEVNAELQARIELSTDVQPRRWLRTYDPHGLSRDSLERILLHCQHLQIQTILVSVPVTHCHRETYTSEIENQFQNAMAELQEKYHIPWFDTREWIADGLFMDNHHLTIKGGEFYSKLLAKYILSQWIIGNSIKGLAKTMDPTLLPEVKCNSSFN